MHLHIDICRIRLLHVRKATIQDQSSLRLFTVHCQRGKQKVRKHYVN